jgi:hypothetical protein
VVGNLDQAPTSDRVRLGPNRTGEGEVLCGNEGSRGRSEEDNWNSSSYFLGKWFKRGAGEAWCCRRCGGAGNLGFVGFTRRHWMGLLVAPVVVGTKETTQPRVAHECRSDVPVLP